MHRDSSIAALAAGVPWDVLVIGGGAVGLGVAAEAAARGYRTALVERADFASGTSSRSTKLIHGGLRYLPQGRIGLVREALRERDELLSAVPELVRPLQFVLPCASRRQLAWYGLGVAVYNRLGGRRRVSTRRNGPAVPRDNARAAERSTILSIEEAMQRVPNLGGVPDPERRGFDHAGFVGAVGFHDAQFDDAAFAVRLAGFAESLGAVVVNHTAVEALLHRSGRIRGAVVRDLETGRDLELESRAVVNASGPFADELRRWDDPRSVPRLLLSRGSHVVLPARFLGGQCALILPRGDRRLHFSIPWRGHVLVGTTDVVIDGPCENPLPSVEEIEDLLSVLRNVLVDAPRREDLTSAFAGIRALVRPAKNARTSADVSREHAVVVSPSGLVSVLGGKWTLYRKVAAEAVDAAGESAGLRTVPAVFPIPREDVVTPPRSEKEDPRADPRSVGCSDPDIVRAVGDEMARTVDDVLARRTRSAFVDVRASLDLAPRVAARMAELLGRDEGWIEAQVHSFRERWSPIADLIAPRS